MNKFYSFIILVLYSIATYILSFSTINAQIEYNWQNSKEGWISGGDCNLTAQPDAMAMRLFSPTGKMISGTASANLGIFGGDYNKVDINACKYSSAIGGDEDNRDLTGDGKKLGLYHQLVTKFF